MCKKEERERDRGVENIFDDITAKDFSSLRKGNRYPRPRKHRAANRISPKSTTVRHTGIKMTKEKIKRILKAAREKQHIIYKGTPIRSSADFSAETLQKRGEWHDIFKVMKKKKLQPRIFYQAIIHI